MILERPYCYVTGGYQWPAERDPPEDRRERPNSRWPRKKTLQVAFAAFQFAVDSGFDLSSYSYRDQMVWALNPLRKNWEVCKTKADAENAVPLMKLLWPDEDFPLPEGK